MVRDVEWSLDSRQNKLNENQLIQKKKNQKPTCQILEASSGHHRKNLINSSFLVRIATKLEYLMPFQFPHAGATSIL